MTVIPATQKAVTGRIAVQGQHRQKVSETPSQQNMLGMVVHAYHPSYEECISKGITIRG
jgi:hypothetical protein